MKTSIMMVTYQRDFHWAMYSLRSVRKFARGFHELVLVVPTEHSESFRHLLVELLNESACSFPFRMVTFEERPGKGMLHHQVKVMEADLICPDADAILHLDADTLFTHPVTPEGFIVTGMPRLLAQPYADIAHDRQRWQLAVEKAIGARPEFETMVRHPLVHRTEVYARTRFQIERHTNQNWMEYALSGPNVYPQEFAEFPTLGAVALAHYADRYIVCIGRKVGEDWQWKPDPGESRVFSFWSHGGLTHENDRHPGRQAIEVIHEILGLPAPTVQPNPAAL